MKRYLPTVQSSSNVDKVITFKVDFKRRNCSHLSRDQVIDALMPIVVGDVKVAEGGKESAGCVDTNNGKVKKVSEKNNAICQFSVDLTDPDISIRVEVCKTLCGISILPRENWHKNFNLAELNQASSESK